ncbi:hypothetical protein H0H81_000036 [Sphagnurus paluster]|uniref:WH1 domain-containing protein n=1 Tax=Sphagnurus paluster TaxID=117069 RepID=A0A9P7FYN6_9AGAR|nr:hypothetical protein H0H81_000036 [Sphagnurus paluster]
MHLAIPGVATNTYTVLGVASARIYHAQLNTKTPEWCYSRMKGTLVFGKDRDPDTIENAPMAPSVQAGNHWFRLLDAVSGKPVWIFKVRSGSGFVYEIDRPFFHAFQGKSRRFGFLFENDDEASALAKEVISQISPPRKPLRILCPWL